jgi:lipid II:glycine glycyltransferase (peptidoglycan interpeptide bridge formation enzyme)
MTAKKTWKFKELTVDEFRKFSDKHELRNYLQTPEIARFRESEGWTGHFVG